MILYCHQPSGLIDTPVTDRLSFYASHEFSGTLGRHRYRPSSFCIRSSVSSPSNSTVNSKGSTACYHSRTPPRFHTILHAMRPRSLPYAGNSTEPLVPRYRRARTVSPHVSPHLPPSYKQLLSDSPSCSRAAADITGLRSLPAGDAGIRGMA